VRLKNFLRSILPAFLITSLTLVTDDAGAGAAAPQQKTQAPAYYRLMLGAFEVTVLSDGTHPFPDAKVLTTPASRTSPARVNLFRHGSTEANRLLKAADLTVPTEGSIDAFLINTGTKLILIDSGAGSLYGSCCGHLISNLRASGYRPEQIDDIFLTHLHEDHVGGIAPGGTMAFPNAYVYASKADADYWLSDAHERAAPAFLRGQFEGAKRSLITYMRARRFKTFAGAKELYPGVRAIPAPGHTPGHTFYQVESQTKRLLIWGDVVHVAALQFTDPSIGTQYDTDATQAEKTRLKVFREASDDRVLVGAMHVSFPGLGHVSRRGDVYVWIPAEYSARL
jgi:glyoxylase-like metal-dependent hydrolase (beta-lactamase superfamily II)